MSDRKETPDLLGDILANRQDHPDNGTDHKPKDTTSVREASMLLGVSKRTIRTWADEFAGHLSSGAKPPKGDIRSFTNDDIVVLETIAGLRVQKASYKEIHTALKASPTLDLEEQPSRQKEIFQDQVRQYEGRIKELEGERDQSQYQVGDLRKQVKVLKEQIKYLKEQLSEALANRFEVEEQERAAKMSLYAIQADANRSVPALDMQRSERTKGETPLSLDRVSTLEDQLKQLGGKDRWWQFWRR